MSIGGGADEVLKTTMCSWLLLVVVIAVIVTF